MMDTGLWRQAFPTARAPLPSRAGQFAIGECLARRYPRQRIPDAALEGGALQVKRQRERVSGIIKERDKLCRHLPSEGSALPPLAARIRQDNPAG